MSGEATERVIITIDGPAGTGKSTTARALARELGFVYLDSGALYRVIALAATRAGIELPEDQRLPELLADLPIVVTPESGRLRIRLGGREVAEELRDQEIGERASRLAQSPAVRAHVGGLLRGAAAARDCVAEGRDMGSTVFPQATLKIFLAASSDARTQRRYAELRGRGVAATREAIAAEIAERDGRDCSRRASPLRAAQDAIVIDNSDLTPGGQVQLIADLYRHRGRLSGSRSLRMSQKVLRLFFGLLGRPQVRGREHLPPGAFLLACNHRASIDPALVGAFFPGGLAFLAKAELFAIPLLGWLIRDSGAIPIRRGAFDRAAIRAVLACLAHACPVLIFPEGTRRPEGDRSAPRGGIGLLARRSGMPVIPARVWNTSCPGRLLRGHARLGLVFGSPLRFPDGEGLSDGAFAARVMEAIRNLPPPE